jgi:hypothetical protein
LDYELWMMSINRATAAAVFGYSSNAIPAPSQRGAEDRIGSGQVNFSSVDAADWV